MQRWFVGNLRGLSLTSFCGGALRFALEGSVVLGYWVLWRPVWCSPGALSIPQKMFAGVTSVCDCAESGCPTMIRTLITCR